MIKLCLTIFILNYKWWVERFRVQETLQTKQNMYDYTHNWVVGNHYCVYKSFYEQNGFCHQFLGTKKVFDTDAIDCPHYNLDLYKIPQTLTLAYLYKINCWHNYGFHKYKLSPLMHCMSLANHTVFLPRLQCTPGQISIPAIWWWTQPETKVHT